MWVVCMIVMSGKEKNKQRKKMENGKWDVRTEGKGREGGGSLRDECEGSLYYGARTHAAREEKVTVYGCSIWLMLTH